MLHTAGNTEGALAQNLMSHFYFHPKGGSIGYIKSNKNKQVLLPWNRTMFKRLTF